MVVNEFGHTRKPGRPLHVATRHRQVDVVRTLIESGADVNAPDEYGQAALHLATYRSGPESSEIIRLLVENGANVHCTASQFGSAPLVRFISMCRCDPLPIVNLLLSHGADVNACNQQGWNALDAAKPRQIKNVDLLRTLIEHGADVNNQPKRDQSGSLLFRVARDGSPELISLLIHAGAELDSIVPRWGTALHSAVRRGNSEAVRLLLEAGANPGLLDGDGRSPLDLTIGYARVASLLAGQERSTADEPPPREGADVTGVVDGGIAYVIGSENDASVKRLLGAKGNVGRLFRAIWEDRPEKLLALLSSDSSLRKTSVRGWTPIKFAAQLGQERCVEFLIQNGELMEPSKQNDDSPLHIAAAQGHSKVVCLLLEAGCNPNGLNLRSESPLTCAAQNRGGDLETVRVLLSAAADPNHRDHFELTPFLRTIAYRNVPAAREMLRFCADVNTPSPDEAHTWFDDPAEWPLTDEAAATRPLYLAACTGCPGNGATTPPGRRRDRRTLLWLERPTCGSSHSRSSYGPLAAFTRGRRSPARCRRQERVRPAARLPQICPNASAITPNSVTGAAGATEADSMSAQTARNIRC